MTGFLEAPVSHYPILRKLTSANHDIAFDLDKAALGLGSSSVAQTILILDEATSALDFKNEKRIQSAIEDFMAAPPF
jgi:hypothetical protein